MHFHHTLQENDGKIDLLTFFIKNAYKLIDCLICQSKDMQKDMVTNYGVSLKKTALINNPITAIYEPKTYSLLLNYFQAMRPLSLRTAMKMVRFFACIKI